MGRGRVLCYFDVAHLKPSHQVTREADINVVNSEPNTASPARIHLHDLQNNINNSNNFTPPP